MGDVLQNVDQIAKLAGITGRQVGDLMSYNFNLGSGRSQAVWVGRFDETPSGLQVICFVSPCQRLGGGYLSSMTRAQAIDMLRINAQFSFGHFCLMNIGEEEMICARTTQILDTMDVEEFKAHCYSVAQMADGWEEKQGRDEF